MNWKWYGPDMKKIDLKSPTSRRSIPIGPKLHRSYIRKGLYLGYRKSKTTTSWFARRWKSEIKDELTQFLGVTDDVLPANDVGVLSHDQAVEHAKKWFDEEQAKELDTIVVEKTYSVRNLMTDYQKFLKDDGCKSLRQTKSTIEKHILPTLGEIPLHKLNHRQVKTWLNNLVESAPRSKATGNRIWNTLRAALNFGYKEGKVSHKRAWDKVQSFKAASKPRIVETTLDDLQELVAACLPHFQQLVKGAILTGCRYSELANLRVRNFYPNTQQIHIEDSKNDHERMVPLNEEGVVLFEELTAHRKPDEFMFQKSTGQPWHPSDQIRPMYAALARSGITKPITFHQLRHGFASLSLQNGMRLEEVGDILGHRDLKITQKHYARFSGSHLLDKVRQCAPQLGLRTSPSGSDKVIPIQRVRKHA
jgi:integrase